VSRWIAVPTVAGPEPQSYDFLAILRAALVQRGLDYRVDAVSKNANIGPVPLLAPAFGCTSVGPPPRCAVSLQDRDVILVNAQTSHLHVLRSRTGHYAAQEVLQLPTGAASLARGWAYVDGTFEGRKFRFLDTHLETGRFASTQEAQAHEFLAGPARANGVVIATGDFNANADPGEEPTTTYEDLTAAWFTDAWQRVDHDDPGYTCCQSPTLTNATSQLRTRIDLVLTHGPVRVEDAEVVGTTPISTGEPPIWASDHAGVVAMLRQHQGRQSRATSASLRSRRARTSRCTRGNVDLSRRVRSAC
jgi:endonuclease/exonuclease/phosphatase family metal-dependent hydrolase